MFWCLCHYTSIYAVMLRAVPGYHSIYTVHVILPSTAASWLFSRPWSGFGGSGGGVFICLMSDSSTAPAEVRWQEEKINRETSEI